MILRALLRLQDLARRADVRIERVLRQRDIPRAELPGDLDKAYATGWRGVRAVFGLSTGRAGTRTLAALLARSPDADAHHEPYPRLVKASFDAYLSPGEERLWEAVVLAARDDLVWAAHREGKIYIETSNRLSYLAGPLSRAFPASRFIHLHRHPYEMVRSALRRGFYQGHPWDFARIVPRPGDPERERWPEMTPLEKSAWNWARVNRAALDFLATLPADRRLSLPSQDLFLLGDATRGLFEFAGLRRPPDAALRRVLAQRLNRQKPERGAEGPLSAAEREAIRRYTAGVAAELGYGLDGSDSSR